MRKVLILLLLSTSLGVSAQVGEYRRDFAVGVNGGYVMSNINFMPEVPQKMLGGMTAGVSMRYTCEKYFKSICAVVAEVNFAQIGWKENILTMQDQPVPLHINPTQSLRYIRKMNYIQIPLLARLGWGRERSGFQFFFQVRIQWLSKISSIMVLLLAWVWSSAIGTLDISLWKAVTIMVWAISMGIRSATISDALILVISLSSSVICLTLSGQKTLKSNKTCSKDNLKDYLRWH